MSTVPDVPIVQLTPQEAVQILQGMRMRMPDFALLSVAEAQTLTPAAAVDVRFVHEAINAIAASANLRDGLGSDAEELRQSLELTDRWSQVVVELDALRVGVLGAMKKSRHRLGGTALQAYQLSRQLVRYHANAELLPHIEAMRRALRPSRSRTTPLVPPVAQVPPESEVKPTKV